MQRELEISLGVRVVMSKGLSLGLSEKKEKCHRDGIGSHLQVGNPRSTGAVQDMGMLEKGKIHTDRLLSWNSYRLLESPAILLEPV